jgi:CubicO group peptidase (beta-lactamase class C family)
MGRLVVLLIALAALAGCKRDPWASYRARAKVQRIGYAAVTKDAVVTAGVSKEGQTFDADTTFAAASIAKPFVATSVLQLVEQKKLDLDAAVEVPFPLHHLSLRMLLSHTACIVEDDRARLPRRPGMDLGGRLRAYFAGPAVWIDGCTPGETYRYSNVGFALAAWIVERAANVPFDDYVRERIWKPLGMTHTGYVGTEPPPMHWVYPASDLRSTPNDLARFMRAILAGGAPILAKASVDLMLDHELGWQKRRIGGRSVVGHEGEDVVTSAGLFLDRAAGTGALVLADGDAFSSDDPARAQALEDMLAELIRSRR